jgi:hypothetical protein
MRRGHGDEVDELTVVGPEVGPDVDRPDLRRILVGLDALAIAVPWSAVLIGLACG